MLYFHSGELIRRTYPEVIDWLTYRGVKDVDWKMHTVGEIGISFNDESLKTMFALWCA